MKKLFLFAFLSVLFFSACKKNGANCDTVFYPTSNPYFPISPGTEWIYEKGNGDTARFFTDLTQICGPCSGGVKQCYYRWNGNNFQTTLADSMDVSLTTLNYNSFIINVPGDTIIAETPCLTGNCGYDTLSYYHICDNVLDSMMVRGTTYRDVLEIRHEQHADGIFLDGARCFYERNTGFFLGVSLTSPADTNFILLVKQSY